jgi:DNA-binding response OmpR family regulator
VILIVDDDAYVLDLVARVLKPVGARLVPATSAAAARTIAASEALSLAIVDIGLREGGGYGYLLAAELREIQGATGRNLTVIALTGQMPDEAAVATAGIAATVMKPFQLAEFRALVSEHLARAADDDAEVASA